MEKTNKMLGMPKRKVEINGDIILQEGEMGTVLLSNPLVRVKVCCTSCMHCQRLDAECLYHCNAVIDDRGYRMQLKHDDRHTTRCEKWKPQPWIRQVMKNFGKVDSAAFVKWKVDNSDIINHPEDYGYVCGTPWREWLTTMYNSGAKQMSDEMIKARAKIQKSGRPSNKNTPTINDNNT